MNYLCYDETTGAKTAEGCCAALEHVTCKAGQAVIEIDRPGHYTHVRDGVPVHDPPGPDPVKKLADIRLHRDILLKDCDWTQLPSARLTPEKLTAWNAYREQLFDFPGTCDPFKPVWPTPPV